MPGYRWKRRTDEKMGSIRGQGKIRVLLVDDQTLFMESLKTVFETYVEDIIVVGLANDGQTAIDLVARKQPDVVLMDVRMPGMNGVESTKIIKKKYPETRVLMLTTFDDDEYVFEALRYGAEGYLLKDGTDFCGASCQEGWSPDFTQSRL